MPDRSEWSVSEPQKLTIEQPVERVRVRIVGGRVNVVGTESAEARLEITAIDGHPLNISAEAGTLTVAHDGLPWEDFLVLFDRKGWQRHAEITLAVPSTVDLRVGVITADAVVSGLSGRTEVRGVKADTTLVALTGPVHAETVSGNVEAQGITGSLRFNSVSGDLTVMDGRNTTVQAESVTGALVFDLTTAGEGTDLTLSTVSGPVAVRLPERPDVVVEATSAGGSASSAYEELDVSDAWANKRVKGSLGEGSGSVRLKSVSGSVALLRQPAEKQEADITTLRKDV